MSVNETFDMFLTLFHNELRTFIKCREDPLPVSYPLTFQYGHKKKVF